MEPVRTSTTDIWPVVSGTPGNWTCGSAATTGGLLSERMRTSATAEIWNQATVNWLASKPLPKGAKVFVQGEIRHDQYTDKDGVDRYFSKVVIAAPGHELKSLDRPETNPADEG